MTILSEQDVNVYVQAGAEMPDAEYHSQIRTQNDCNATFVLQTAAGTKVQIGSGPIRLLAILNPYTTTTNYKLFDSTSVSASAVQIPAATAVAMTLAANDAQDWKGTRFPKGLVIDSQTLNANSYLIVLWKEARFQD